MKIIVTGGSGFIGSNLVKKLLKNKKYSILNLDIQTSSSVPESLFEINKYQNYIFKKIDITNYNKINMIFNQFKPNYIFNLAAETHVDTSIKSPKIFMESNIIGTFNLLDISYKFILKNRNKKFKFIHVSTDEVYGSLSNKQKKFDESSIYLPNSPYSASKAASDHLVRAWNKTYKLPTIITHCSNNYGPWQNPEKLIPLVIYKCLNYQSIPVYGKGLNIRDWIHVDDHNNVLISLLKDGKVGEVYNIGTNNEITNLKLIKFICKFFDSLYPDRRSHISLIKFVKDRAGHDQRYAINNKKIIRDLNFVTKYNLKEGIKETILWYINNYKWLNKAAKK